jgi:hydroxymethylbilane synthase
VRDALISKNEYTLETLPSGAVVGTSSLRRAAQILSARPNLSTKSLRGNVDTRLRKALDGQYDAIILAGAGITRLGLEEHVTQWLPLDVMLPAPGQGALGIQCRADDEETLSLLSALEDAPTRAAVTAERQFLLGLGGGCAVPVAAYAEQMTREQRTEIRLSGLVSSLDGKKIIRVHGQSDDPLQLGDRLAEQALTEGAQEILSLIPNH